MAFSGRRGALWACFALSLCSPVRGARPLRSLLALPEDQIDVGVAALQLAQDVFSDVDVAAGSAHIDALASAVRALAAGSADPDRRIRALNTVLWLDEGFRADPNDRVERESERYYLNRVLQTKRGNCFSMPLLYVAVAQRLNWPVRLVHLPDHYFVRYVAAGFREQNIETTSGGGFVSDERYAEDFRVSERGREAGAYLRSLSRRETLAELVAVNAVTLARRRHWDEAIARLEAAVRLNPRLADAWAGLADAYAARGDRNASERCARARDALGFVDPREVPPFR